MWPRCRALMLASSQGCRSVEEFQCLNRIEEGTYGVVYRAKDKKTGGASPRMPPKGRGGVAHGPGGPECRPAPRSAGTFSVRVAGYRFLLSWSSPPPRCWASALPHLTAAPEQLAPRRLQRPEGGLTVRLCVACLQPQAGVHPWRGLREAVEALSTWGRPVGHVP